MLPETSSGSKLGLLEVGPSLPKASSGLPVTSSGPPEAASGQSLRKPEVEASPSVPESSPGLMEASSGILEAFSGQPADPKADETSAKHRRNQYVCKLIS